MPLEDHEFFLRLIERFIIILIVEMGMQIKTMGSTTPKPAELDRRSKPDCAHHTQNQPYVAGRTVDLAGLHLFKPMTISFQFFKAEH